MVLPKSPYGKLKKELKKIQSQFQKILQDPKVRSDQSISSRISVAQKKISETITHIEQIQSKGRQFK